MLHDDGQFYGYTQHPKPVSTLIIIHKKYLCLHDTHCKRSMVYTISRPIFRNSYIIIQGSFFGLLGLEGEF